MTVVLDKMTMEEMCEVSGLPRSLIRKRIMKYKPLKTDSERWAVTSNLLLPSSDSSEDGLFPIMELCRRYGVAEQTMRKRVDGLEPDFVILRSMKKLFRMTEELRKRANPSLYMKERRRISEAKLRSERKGYNEKVLSMLKEEDVKRSWVGKRGILLNEKGLVIARGVVESVSCCGVTVDGTQGMMKYLKLEDENGEMASRTGV